MWLAPPVIVHDFAGVSCRRAGYTIAGRQMFVLTLSVARSPGSRFRASPAVASKALGDHATTCYPHRERRRSSSSSAGALPRRTDLTGEQSLGVSLGRRASSCRPAEKTARLHKRILRVGRYAKLQGRMLADARLKRTSRETTRDVRGLFRYLWRRCGNVVMALWNMYV